MRQRRMLAEEWGAPEVAVLPTDTLLHALGLMQQHRLQVLPVVEETGRFLGLVSEGHILAAWRLGPILPVGLVMAVGPPVKGRWLR